MYCNLFRRCYVSGEQRFFVAMGKKNFAFAQFCPYSGLSMKQIVNHNSPTYFTQQKVAHNVHFHRSATVFKDNSEQEEANISSGMKLMVMVRQFGNGVKQLYYDMKRIRTLMTKNNNSSLSQEAPQIVEGVCNAPFSREELQFMFRTRKDLMKMLPTVILFCIPFIGYLAPVIAFMFPDKLLTRHFLTPALRDNVRANTNASKKDTFTQLNAKLGEDTKLQNFYPAIVEQYSGSPHRAGPAQSSMKIKDLPTEYQGSLCSGWDVRSAGKLSSYLLYIYHCDWLISLEGGVKKLETEDLIEACLERGLHFDSNVDEERKHKELAEKLEKWIAVTTCYNNHPEGIIAVLPAAQYTSQ